MDKEKLERGIAILQDKLIELDPSSDEYKAVTNALEKLHDMLLKEERADEERMDHDRRFELEENRLEMDRDANDQKVKQSRIDNIWGFIGKVFAGITSVVLVFCLDEVKRESIIDKDAFSVARGWFPRS